MGCEGRIFFIKKGVFLDAIVAIDTIVYNSKLTTAATTASTATTATTASTATIATTASTATIATTASI